VELAVSDFEGLDSRSGLIIRSFQCVVGKRAGFGFEESRMQILADTITEAQMKEFRLLLCFSSEQYFFDSLPCSYRPSVGKG